MELHNVLILIGVGSLWGVGIAYLLRINRTVQCAECPHCRKAAEDKDTRQAEVNHEYDHQTGAPCDRPYCRIGKDPVE